MILIIKEWHSLKKEFKFVPPTEIYLGKNKLKQDCFSQYVSIINTVKSLLSDTEIARHISEYQKRIVKSEELTDVIDEIVYKKNLFQNCPNTLAIILFQYAFKIVNLLGSARKKA